MILKCFLAMLWLIFMPISIGTLLERKKVRCNLPECFIKGYLLMFALAEIMILPMSYLKLPLHILVWSYGSILVVLAFCGCFFIKKWKIQQSMAIMEHWKSCLFLFAAIAFILLQIAMVVLYAHMDADDAMYVGAATTAVETDTIYSINPYTGRAYRKLPSRYVLSPFPVFLAVVSQLSGGLHPAIMAHTILPAVFMLLVYLVMYQLGRKWFQNDIEAQGIFLLCTAIMNWFSAYSVYNAGNFQMVRLWQGKALLAAALLPLIYYVASSLLLEKNNGDMSWLTLLMLDISCCLVSSMGIILSVLAIGCIMVISFLKWKDIKRCFMAAGCCIPSVLLGVVYIFIK